MPFSMEIKIRYILLIALRFSLKKQKQEVLTRKRKLTDEIILKFDHFSASEGKAGEKKNRDILKICQC